jgi:hypothetical protein
MGHTGDKPTCLVCYKPHKLRYSSSKTSTVTMKNTIFWDMTMYTVAEIYRFFEGLCCLHLRGQSVRTVEMKVERSLKMSVNFHQTI